MCFCKALSVNEFISDVSARTYTILNFIITQALSVSKQSAVLSPLFTRITNDGSSADDLISLVPCPRPASIGEIFINITNLPLALDARTKSLSKYKVFLSITILTLTAYLKQLRQDCTLLLNSLSLLQERAASLMQTESDVLISKYISNLK